MYPVASIQEANAAKWLIKFCPSGGVGSEAPNQMIEKALADIANGADVADTLDAAVDEINANIQQNKGYGHK